jgi:photosystem II stability/assembly factor-like uncharacterized protein
MVWRRGVWSVAGRFGGGVVMSSWLRQRTQSPRIRATALVTALVLALLGTSLLPGLPALFLSPNRDGPPASQPYDWRNVVVNGGGFVTGLEFSPAQPGLAYARTDIGGAYRWDDDEERWVPLTDWLGWDDWNLYGIESVAPDPVDANRVYLAAGSYTSSVGGRAAILRSSDQGRTWKRTNLPFKLGANEDGRSMGERLAVVPDDNRVLYLGTRNDGLWRSVDYGATWSRVRSFRARGLPGVGVAFVLPLTRHTIYAGVADPRASLVRSVDGGRTWRPVPRQPRGLLPHHAAVARDGSLWVTYADAPGPNGMTDGAVWRLDPRRDRWRDVTPRRPNRAGEPGFGYTGLAVDPSAPGTVTVSTNNRWAGSDGLFRTTDAGRRWHFIASWRELDPTEARRMLPLGVRTPGAPTVVSGSSGRLRLVRQRLDITAAPYLSWGGTPRGGWWIGDVAVDPFDPDRVLYTTGATIFGTDDMSTSDRGESTHWSVWSQGIEETAVKDLVSPPEGAPLLSAVADLGGFRHDSLTVSPQAGMFQNPILTTGTSIDVAGRRPEVVVRVGLRDSAPHGAVSRDGGRTWRPFATEPDGTAGGGFVAVSADGRVIVWSTEEGRHVRSTDAGRTWRPVRGLPFGVEVEADRVDPRRFYAFDGTSARLLRSVDGGRTFRPVGGGLVHGEGQLRPVPGRAGNLWLAGWEGGLLRSTDGGRSFQPVPGVGAAEAVGFGKAALGRDHPAVFVVGRIGGVRGVFRSDDVGESWVRVNDDDHQYGKALVVTGDPRRYGRVYLGTNGRGIVVADPD